MSNNIKGKCVGRKIGNVGSFFLEAHVPTGAGDAYDMMASLKAKTGPLNHTGVRSMREQSIGDDDDEVPSPKIPRLSQYCTDRQNSSSKHLGVSYSDITTYADPFPENEQDVGYSSHSTCSSCQGPEGAATDQGSPLLPQETQWDLENCQKDVYPQNRSSEIDDLIYHFERFFHERFEDELQNFRDSVHAMISDQQAHVRQIVHSAVCEAQVKELSWECTCKCGSTTARETGGPQIFTEAHANTRSKGQRSKRRKCVLHNDFSSKIQERSGYARPCPCCQALVNVHRNRKATLYPGERLGKRISPLKHPIIIAEVLQRASQFEG